MYYPGTEIHGYMPHRGDFARVSMLGDVGEGCEDTGSPPRSLMMVLRPSLLTWMWRRENKTN